MKLTYNEKFKDRSPEETVKIIHEFFTNMNFSIEVKNLLQSKSSTWSCHIELLYNNQIILSQNGKGTTKEYCLASGYGELYERFCSKYFVLNNFTLSRIFMEQQYKNYGYYFDKDEITIDFNMAFSTTQSGKEFLEIFNVDNSFHKFMDILMDNKYIGIPFKNSNDKNELLYIEPRLLSYLHGSSGLACGNSFFEAFNQGMSEIYEHSVSNLLFKELHNQYYYLDLTKINNIYLQNIIAKIEENNYLYIIDLSYIYKVPVLMSLIINKTTHAISINLGSFPIFDIALERILTELYQGFESFSYLKTNGQFPYRLMTFETLQEARNNSEVINPSFKEEILFRLQKKENHSNIFLNGTYSNEEIYNYILQLNSENNYNIYYYIHSCYNNMYSIELLDISHPQCFMNLQEFKQKITAPEIITVINTLQLLYKIIDTYIITKVFDLEQYIHICEQINNFNSIQLWAYYFLQRGSNPLIITSAEVIDNLSFISIPHQIQRNKINLFNYKNYFIQNFQKNIYIYDRLLTYNILYRYATSNYTLQEMLDIFNILHLNYNLEDIIYLNNDEYWLNKILLADIENYFTENFKQFINIISKGVNS